MFCLPSNHEPFGIVLLEAMAQGMPIVATDSEGPSEILRDGVDGDVVPIGDAERLAHAVHRMIADPERAGRLGANRPGGVPAMSYDLPRVAARIDCAVRGVVADVEAQWLRRAA